MPNRAQPDSCYPTAPMRYGGRVLRAEAVDGDTIACRVDLGFHVHLSLRVRLDGIDTPEVRTRDELHKAAGLRATTLAERWLADAEEPLWFVSTARPKYAGRAIGRITDARGHDLGADLLAMGAGKPYAGGIRAWTEAELRAVLAVP